MNPRTYFDFDELLYAVDDEQLSVATGAFSEFNKVSRAKPAVGSPHFASGYFVAKVPWHNTGPADVQLARTSVFLDRVPVRVDQTDLIAREDVADRSKHVVVPVRHRCQARRFCKAVALHHVTAGQNIMDAFDHRPVQGSCCNIDAFDAGKVIRLDDGDRVGDCNNKRRDL